MEILMSYNAWTQLQMPLRSSVWPITDASDMPADSHVLSTRSVKTWVEKLDGSGQPSWLRRSCLVAREFTWMDAERDSCSHLPAMQLCLDCCQRCVLRWWNMGTAALTGKTPFLTVKQQTPTIVNCLLAAGQITARGLGRVLLGQRDGSHLWHRDITQLMKSELGMSPHILCPCIFKSVTTVALCWYMWLWINTY